jgi:hypothetical protein
MSKRSGQKHNADSESASLQLIVALVRPRGSHAGDELVGELSASRVLVARGEATGGVLCAWAGEQLAFAFEPSALDAAIDLALHARTREPWSIALVEGHCEIDPAQSRPRLAVGWALTRALDLAQIGRAGDVLVDRRLTAMRDGDINRIGWRYGRDVSGRPLRGALLDVEQPWARDVAAHEGHFVTPPLVGRPDPKIMLSAPGTLAVLRANPGMGGSRFLGEVRAHAPPGMSLLLTPTVTTLEPLGALRAAMLRALAEGETDDIEPELVPARERLLQGEGVTLDMAATIIAAHVTRGEEAGAILVDDASELDASSLEACTRAMFLGRFSLIARIDADSQIPAVLGGLAVGPEVELGPLSREHAEQLAAASTGGALDREGQRRWARLGGNGPLGILASLRASLAQGELAWVGKYAYPRRRASGTGQVTHPSFWIARSAALASMPAQCVLAVITLAGGEAAVHAVERALEAAGAPVVARTEIDAMLASGWLVETAPGWIALPTRTHRDAVLGELMDEETRHATHQALASSLGETARGLGLAEVAFHAARGGDGKLAARTALQAARQANLVGLAASATQLIALAKREDPTCEEEAQRHLETSIASGRAAMSEPVRKASSDALMAVRVLSSVPAGDDTNEEIDSQPASSQAAEEWEDDAPTIGPMLVGPLPKVPLPVSDRPPVRAPRNGTTGLRWLAREALASADPAALEQWTASLSATGEHPRYAERLAALARLTRGDVGDALRILRGARAELEGENGAVRTQASLALAVALASSGRIDEALLETLDGLARARVANDTDGSRACLAFLSKLYKMSGRAEGAREIRAVLEQNGGIERSAE